MLAAAPVLIARRPADPAVHHGVLRRRDAVLLTALLLLLGACAGIGLHLIAAAAEARSVEALESLVRELGCVAGLLALALLLGAIVIGVWMRQQARECRANEARAREHVLELAWQKEAALAASEAKTRFLAQFGHELRTPLNAILGFAQLIEIHPKLSLSEAPRGWIEGMTRAAWHLHALCEDLPDIPGIESGRPRLKLQALAVEPLVGDVLRMVQLQADQAGVRLAPLGLGLGLGVASAASHFAMADALRLRQILLNLLGNAIKYGRRGGHVRVELELEQDADAQQAPPQQGSLLLRVVDNGMGMDRSQLARLFEPYNRLGRERSAIAGSGIGLALVRQLVWLMNGDIRVESQPGIGTTVHLRLPAASAPDPDPDPDRRRSS